MVSRIVILTSGRSGPASECLPELCASGELHVVGVILAHRASISGWKKIRRKIRKVLRIGIGGALNGIRMRTWYADVLARDIADVCAEENVPFFEVPHVNGEETRELFRRLEPELGVSLSNSYISQRVFTLPKFGMINVHGERLPQYQNAQSVIWPIYHDETKTGLTIHQIDKGIDTGAILYREEFDILFSPRLEDTVRRTIAVTRARTARAVRLVCENYPQLAADAIKQVPGNWFTTPSLFQFFRMVRNNTRQYRRSIDGQRPG